ncbi:MAG: ABC transporter permease [Patescibacteria group bacterium]
MEIFRNMWRRKFRTFLTIMGIAIGIFAFTVMGSLALKFNKMIDGGKRYITGQITIMPKGSAGFGPSATNTLPLDTLNQIAEVEGVEAVGAGVELPYAEPDPNNISLNMGVPPTIEGYDLNSTFQNRNWTTLSMKEGRMLQRGDRDDQVVLGISIATDKKVRAGDKITIRGKEFTVLGVMNKTMTGPDSFAMMSINPAREMLVLSNPFLNSLKEQSDKASQTSDAAMAKLPADIRTQLQQAKTFKMEDLSTGASVSWKDGYDSETVSNRIKDQFGDKVTVLSPKSMGEQIDKAMVMFNAVILGAALLALIVGSFSIINTMIMSISERTREIGIKKAIGATDGAVAREYTLEAGMIGLIGGIVGLGMGIIMIVLVNNKLESKGAEIFLLDTNFIVEVIAFSFILGIVAGVIPAWRASRLNLVKALREE